VFLDRFAGKLPELVIGELAARDADDSRPVWELACKVAMEQRWKKFALGQIPGGPEDDEVEQFDGYGAGRHYCALRYNSL
jgi:hypothetical protein